MTLAPKSTWGDSWWYATEPLETLMWDGKTSTKALRSLIKSLGESHVTLGNAYAENASKKIRESEHDTFGRFWSSMMENARRRSQVHLQCGKFLCEHANGLQDWRYAQSKHKRAVFSKIKTTEGTYERAKQKVEYAKRKYISACKRATRLIQKRDQNSHLTNGTVHSKASLEQDQLRVDQALREVKSEQMQYVVWCSNIKRSNIKRSNINNFTLSCFNHVTSSTKKSLIFV